MPRKDLVEKSTWEILVIPPFFAAALMPTFAEPPSPKYLVVDASPHLFPTGLDVAVIGVVVEQLAHIAANAKAANEVLIVFFICNKFLGTKYPLVRCYCFRLGYNLALMS